MPTYDYQCDACDHCFELFQKISDPVKRKCPECGRLKLRRLFGTGAAILFKGSGFYKNDARGSSKKTASSSSGSTSSDTSSSSTEKKSETKTETKAAPAASSTD